MSEHSVKKFTIVREKWARGRDGNNTALLNREGEKCCLGFFSNACGFSDDEIRYFSMPSGAAKHYGANGLPEWMIDATYRDEQPVVDLVRVNDESKHSDEYRERRITEIFAEHGVEVEFV